MKLPDIQPKTDALFILFGLCFVFFGWFSLSLTLSGLLRFSFVLTGATLLGGAALFILWKLFLHAPNDVRFVFTALLLYATFIGYVSEPTIFSGRDQGSIAEAAIRLAQNQQLAFSTPASTAFFEIYGPGTALNFPGFAYTKEGDLITQFPLGYIAWLGAFISLFGVSGIILGNALLLFLFLFTLYGLLRFFVRPLYASLGLILAATSFLPIWFSKMTLTENMSVFLFTLLALSLTLFLREGKFIFYAGALGTAVLFSFVRLEGLAFFGITLGILLLNAHARSIWKTYPWKSIVLPGIVFLFFFLRNFFLNLPYYKIAGKGLLKFTDRAIDGAAYASTGIGAAFFLYGLLILFIVGVFGFFIFWKKRGFLCFVPMLLALPTFFYFFSPNITPDHPWMLRRFLFSIFPTLVFSATLAIAFLSPENNSSKPSVQKKHVLFSVLLFCGLFFFQYPAWSKYLTFAEARGLTAQISAFSQEFSERDLILVDRFATGDGFMMLSGPAQFLFGKNAVYFFNPYDLERLDTSRFERVYLLVPEEDFPRYATVFGERLTLEKTITFSLERLEPLSLRTGTLRLPQKITSTTRNILFRIH